MFPPAKPPVAPKTKKPLPKEEKNTVAKIMPWLLVAIGVGAIGAMIIMNPKQKTLVCHNNFGGGSLTAMGSCTEE